VLCSSLFLKLLSVFKEKQEKGESGFGVQKGHNKF
jgi:hypothetical protein